ncbi:MAG TPA: site-specific integrase [Paludibacter sp.]|nr:site-specific integrase [Paludibacter sp.]
MSKINIYYRSDSKTKSEGYIWVKFYIGSDKLNFSTHVKCEEKNWDQEKKRVRSGDKTAKDKNLIIANVESRINDVFVKYRLKNRKLTKDGFLKSYNRQDDFDTFFEFCEAYQREISSYLEAPTIANHNKALNKLKDYQPNLTFDDIDHDFLEKYFKSHLLKTEENMHSTAYKDMATIKKYVRAAMRKGFIEQNPFAEFKIKRVEGRFSYLTKDEISRLLKLYYSGRLEPDYQKTLQLFLFMCFGSQHVTDALNTKIEDIHSGYLHYMRVKTRNKKPELVEVSASDMLYNIVADIVGYRKTGLIFVDMPQEQTMNKYLKRICKRDDVKINKNISTKTGRHTFATFYLSETKDLNALKKQMGHSDIRETLKYAHVMESDEKENIKCFNTFLSVKSEISKGNLSPSTGSEVSALPQSPTEQ